MVIKINYTSSDVYVSTSVSPVYVVVNYSAVNNGSGVAWGAITGTLSNQTDLQNALDAKVPYTGATTNVNLGEFELKAGQMTLDITPTGTAAVGTTRWNDTNGVSETTLKGGSVILKNGVDLVARVVNKVTPNTTLTKAAYQAVRVSGAQGQRLAVELAQANNDANSADTIGLVTETINANQEGFIMTVGQLENINTTGSLQGETWVDGDVLYLSPTTAGAITKVKPTGNGHIVVIGYVEYAHVNNGKIYVKVMNGWELDELHDVAIVSPANNEALIYESATSLWKNKTIATALGYTPISGTGATGQVAYWNGTSSQTGSNNLFWDAANARLGIGTTTPTHPINILSTNASLGFRLEHATPSSASFPFQITNSADTNYIRANVNIIELFRNGGASTIRTKGSNNELLIQSVRHLQLAVNDGTIGAQLFSTGNLILQNGGTFSDGGQRLQVYGDAFIKGSGNTSATTALTVQNSDGTVYLQFINDGRLQLGTASNNVQIFPFNTSQAPSLTSRNLMFYSPNGSQVASEGRFKFDGNGLTQTSGIVINIKSSSIFSPTSGTATYQELNVSPQINQTGGANGITRGLYVQPTLTAAADWRSIEWSNNSGFGLYGAGTANNYLAGSLGIGTTSPSASAILQADSTTRGFLPPRMTNAQRTAIGSPAVGLLVYQTDATEGTYEYISSGWRIINGGGGGSVDELQVSLICQVFG
jgi:nitrogen fixation protein